jgi:preprotein translocase subunit SecE
MSSTESQKPKFSFGTFIRETRNEMAKVTWPSRKETMVTTSMVVIMALVTGVFFLIVDSALGAIISRILGMNS